MTKEEKHTYLINNGWKTLLKPFDWVYIKHPYQSSTRIFGTWFDINEAFETQQQEDYKQEFDKLVNG